MKYFNKDSKFNFVDENNVVVGYDSHQDCCENAAWSYTHNEPTTFKFAEIPTPENYDTEAYNFDPAWFRELTETRDSLDEGGAVAFRLTAEGKPDLYLVLSNSHNGYYSHGFTLEVGGIVARNGSL
jgi:hypothetical protein